MVVEDLLEDHPVSGRKLKEVLGHTPRQVRALPGGAVQAGAGEAWLSPLGVRCPRGWGWGPGLVPACERCEGAGAAGSIAHSQRARGTSVLGQARRGSWSGASAAQAPRQLHRAEQGSCWRGGLWRVFFLWVACYPVVRCLSLCAHRSLPPAAQVLCGAILGVVVGLLYPTPPPMPLP